MNNHELEEALKKIDFNPPVGKSHWDTPEYEFVSMRVSKEAAKVLKDLDPPEKMQEKVIRQIIHSKYNWFEAQVNIMDETVIRYQANCLKIKDQFTSISSTYDEALSDLENILFEKQSKLQEMLFDPFKKHIDEMEKAVKKMNEAIDAMDAKVERTMGKVKELPNSYQLTEVVRLAGEWDRLSDKSKALLAPLFSTPEEKSEN